MKSSPKPKAVVPKWTPRDQNAALRLGWGLFESTTRGLEIQRDDEADKFDSDESAAEFVARAAKQPRKSKLRTLAQKALAAVAAAPRAEPHNVPPSTRSPQKGKE